MADTVAFRFRSGTGFLHRMDPRFKMITLAAISLSLCGAGVVGLLVLTVLFIILALDCGLQLKTVVLEFRYFIFFLLVVFIARCFTEPGEAVVSIRSIVISKRGVIEGALAAWRLALIFLLGLLMSISTRPKEIRVAVENLLAPIPFVKERRIAVMIGLVVRFIPVILSLAADVSAAQRARAVEQRRNPFYRLSCFVLPLLRRTIDRAEKLTIAMEARCFDGERATVHMVAQIRDYYSLVFVFFLCLGLLWVF